MNKLDSKRILQAFPNHYYVIDYTNYKIIETNNSEVQVGDTCCYQHIYGFSKPCDQIVKNINCACTSVLKYKKKVEIVHKIESNKDFKAYKVIANPVFEKNHNIEYIIAHYIDITKDLELEFKLTEKNNELLSQNEEYLMLNEELKEQKEEFEILSKRLKEKNEKHAVLNKDLVKSYEQIEKAKKEIERLKDFFESINEAVQDGIWVSDKNDVIFYTNPAMEHIAGISRIDIINKNVLKDFPKEMVKELVPYFNKAKEELKAIWYEVAVKTPSKKGTFQNGWLVPMLKDGKYSGMICTVRDITERANAEQHLRKSEAKFRLLFENMKEAFAFHKIVCDKENKAIDYIFIDVNPEFEKQTGLKRNEIINKSVLDVLPKIEKYWIENYGKVALTGKAMQFENYAREIDRHYKVIAYSPKKNYFATIFEDITQSKQAESLLIQNEEKYRRLTENSPNITYIYSLKRGALYWSSRVKEIMGLDPAKLTRDSLIWTESIHQEDRNTVMNFFKNIEVGKNYELEYRIYDIEHKMHWFKDRIFNVYAQDNDVILEGIVIDITEQKNNENALKESEERYRELFESANVAIGMSTISGIILAANKAMTIMLGYSNKELFEQKIQDVFVNINDLKVLIDTVKKEGEIQNLRVQMYSKSRNILWVQISAQLFDLKHNDRLLFVISDITKEIEAEMALLKQEKKFRTYIELSPIPVFIANSKAQYEYVNEAASILLGYSKEELQSIFIPDLLLKENLEKEIESFNTFQKTGFLKDYESKFVKKDRSIVEISISAVKLTDNEFIAFCTDITQIKKYEHNLKEKNEEYYALNEELEDNIERIQKINLELKIAKDKAEESDRLKSAFLANMSHEIRTPLNGILGFSVLLRKTELTKESRERYSAIVERSGQRLLSVVNDVFDISLIQSNQIKIEKHAVAVNDIMDELFSLYQILEKDKLQTIDFSLKKNSINEMKICNDKYRLNQVFSNLINNAFKFTSKGEIEFGYLPVMNKEITFYVKDTGIGIPIEYQDTIFNPFRQVDDSTTRDYEGAGLGLSICSGLLERMGGKIWLESELNMGTVIYFTLPLEAKPQERKKEVDLKETKKKILNEKMILIVEDDLVNYEYLRIFVENLGGGVIIQTSYGKEAVKIIEKNKIDLIFMDIRLPDMDGYETTRMIREHDKKVIIIAQIDYPHENDRKKVITAGCNNYITKPLKEEGLLKMIERYFG